MKKLFLLLVIASGFALGCGEADTVFPGDATYYNTSTPEGTTITTLTATVSNDLTATNPLIRIRFDTPVNDPSVVYDTTIQVESPIGNLLTEGTVAGQYNAFPDFPLTAETDNIIIDLNNIPHGSGTVIQITLTSVLNSYLNPLIPLSNPGTFVRTIP